MTDKERITAVLDEIEFPEGGDERMLANIQKKAKEQTQRKKPAVYARILRWAIPIAACFMIVFSVIFASTRTIDNHLGGENTGVDVTSQVDPSGGSGERPLKAIESYREYEKFVKDVHLNSKIVTYEQVKVIGDFRSFVVLSDAQRGDYSDFLYCFRDRTNSAVILELYVTDLNVRTPPNYHEEISFDGSYDDMRKLSTDQSGYVIVDGVEYHYILGELQSIEWEKDHWRFALTGNSMLGDYPAEGNEFIKDLLSCKNVLEHINSIG